MVFNHQQQKENDKKKNKNKCTRNIYLYLIISISLTATHFSCSAPKRNNTTTELNQTTSLKPKFDVSAKTRQFLKDLEDDLNSQKTALRKYTPSINMIDKYDIIQIENLYYVSGMVMTNETYDIFSLKEIGVKIGYQSGKFTTTQILVNQFDLFLEYQGIAYFQISEKTKAN
jgi:hypothetical protein